MDSRASTSTITSNSKPKPLLINTSNHTSMVSKTLAPSPSSPFTAFRPSPLNPTSSLVSSDTPAYPQKRGPAFPASRPLRPFPSVAQSIANTKPIVPSAGVHVRNDGIKSPSKLGGESAKSSSGKRPQKTIEISSKWKGGFFVLGMTQAEFSRKD